MVYSDGMETPVRIDGSRGEGGGQILRSCLTLSLITGRPVHLERIRANRKPRGLKAQHLTSVRAAARVGSARVQGDALGSEELVFEPGAVHAGHFRFDIGTAGSIGLVLETVHLPLALRAGGACTVEVTGGTHVKQSPSVSFLGLTWRGWMQRLGLELELEVQRTGFYPRGGGHVTMTVQPATAPRALELAHPAPPGKVVSGFAAVAGLPETIALRMARRAEEGLARERIRASLNIETWPGGPGAVIGLADGSELVPALFVALGERGKTAERVAEEAVRDLVAHRAGGGGVDEHSADQLVLPLAFARSPSTYAVARVTQHLLTNVGTLNAFLDREVSVEGEEGQPGRVRIAG